MNGHRPINGKISGNGDAQAIIGNSVAMQCVRDLIVCVAPSDSTVCIVGESGVGKELVAQQIHRASPRAESPFVVIDSAALQENLLESELFGHERGAYTGAGSLKHGLFEIADSGVVFLDEVGELGLGIQAKLLRVLETGRFRRLGGTKDIRVDVRVLAATNRNLEQAVAESRFRKDLYFRLNVITIPVPPLRGRREDILQLVEHFLPRVCAESKGIQGISDEAVSLLTNYEWPGNVRELLNSLESSALLCKGNRILPKDLPDSIRTSSPTWQNVDSRWCSMRQAEQQYITRVLKHVGGHRAHAAEILGISERQLYRKIRSHRISV